MNGSLGWFGAVCGAVAGVGLVLVYAGLPFHRRPTLISRMAPYLRDASGPSRLLAAASESLNVNRLLAPVLHRLGAAVETVLGGTTSVRRRLERAGQPADVEGFRAQQAMWGVLSGLGGCAYVALDALRGGASVVSVVGVVVGSVALGVVARDQMLTRAAEQREQRVLAEFPAVAEMLALAVTAGEGPVAALERVARLSGGALSVELNRCLVEARAGASLPEALQGLGERTGVAGLTRFVDGTIVAIERGTPLADVMRAQAQDAREASKQQLIEIGGRREILMMIPVVFLVLPVTVLFAVFPGVSVLNLTI